MEFKLIYGNHNNGAIQIYDTLMLIKHGLECIGHKVDLEKNLQPGKVNILIEFFTYDFIEVAREFYKTPGTEYIIVATEFITGNTFNNFEGLSTKDNIEKSGQYSDLRPWAKRYRTFNLLYEMALSVWHLSEYQVENYKKSLGKNNIYYLPHGYLETMQRLVDKPWKYKDIDIIFTGTRTPYRDELLSKLEKNALTVVHLPILTMEFIREDFISRTKLALNIRQNSQWKYPSNSRFYYHLVNASPLLSEVCPLNCDLSPFVYEAEINDMVDTCKELINLGEQLKSEALNKREEFREVMPMTPLMERLVDESYNAI